MGCDLFRGQRCPKKRILHPLDTAQPTFRITKIISTTVAIRIWDMGYSWDKWIIVLLLYGFARGKGKCPHCSSMESPVESEVQLPSCVPAGQFESGFKQPLRRNCRSRPYGFHHRRPMQPVFQQAQFAAYNRSRSLTYATGGQPVS